MKSFVSLIFLLTCLSSLGQSIKPTYYADVNGYIIEKRVFLEKSSVDKPINERYFSVTFKNDTCHIKKLVKRKNYGRLTDSKLKELLSNINADTKGSNEKLITISYHPGRDGCNNGNMDYNGIRNNIYNIRLIKRALKKYNHKTYWVHKYDASLDFHRAKGIDWQLDANQMIEKLFFKHSYPCNSFVVINTKNGNYISLLGESGADSVIDIVKELGSRTAH
ncbi:hypothetical protein [Psychroserpens sp. SPM9]|uniref:hypothetical protein n=1 Tax=Psychroserpens sp. SPM9 TaxID=2975598 RepID=UPI0021A36FB1|nr:hypothetical protein [Psychroserpens sp. SPM9]MDG5491409.1 hypothetical protein [Psychroserpens sp. SPM9]